MKLSDYDFDLPEGLIATRPARPRSASRLLVATDTNITDAHAFDLIDFLRPGDRLVLNDTKVIQSHLDGTRSRHNGSQNATARIQVNLLNPGADGNWLALLKPLKKVRPGEVLIFSEHLTATLVAKSDGTAVLKFNCTGASFDQELARVGAMPLPPYIQSIRPADAKDLYDYQTIWAAKPGAVAAPTASLHFDRALLDALTDHGITTSHVTLHVGAGTFLPVKVDNIRDHKMHSEQGHVSAQAAREIRDTQKSGGRVIPVGTTALRLIETAAQASGIMSAWSGDTDIFITPGYRFQVADALVTNFHLPKSTLLMLVSAMMGRQRMHEIYDHAILRKYRFFSYGDASLLIPPRQMRQS